MQHQQMKQAMSDLRLIVEDPRDIKTRRPSTTDEFRKCELKRLIEACDNEIEEIKAQVNKADEANVTFAEYVNNLTVEKREADAANIARFEGLVDDQICHRAKRRLREIAKARFEFSLEYDEVSCKLGSMETRANQRQPVRAEGIQLPTLQIDKFSGDRMRWPEFYENFNAAVHKASISKIQKMTYLRSLLVGEAKSIIEGLELNGTNYDIAITLLQQRYDNKDERIRELYHRLSTLKTCRTFEECKDFSTKLECICRQLEAAGESVESRQMYLSAEQKLSKPMLRDMLREKEQAGTWTMALFRTKLQDLITREEAFLRVSNISHQEPTRFQRPAVVSSQPREFRRFQPPNQSLAFAAPTRDVIPSCPKTLFQRTTTKATISPTQASGHRFNKPKCQFCSGEHGAEECNRYKSVGERTDRVKADNLCFKCLRGDHRIRQCKIQRGCRHCERPHHAALCPNKYGRPIESEVSTTATAQSSANRVLLMTASAIIQNPETSMTQEVTLFFDTGSHRSFVTRDIVQKMKLRVQGKEQLSLCTFGAAEPKEYSSSRVSASVQARNGLEIPLQLNVVDDIIPKPVPMAIINDKDGLSFDRAGRFVDQIMVHKNPDILIGIDHLHEFKISTEKELESGYVISSSVIGQLISGKSNSQGGPRCQTELSLLTVDTENRKTGDNLFDLVQDHFELEKAGTEEDLVENEEMEILEAFNKSLSIVEGRYEVTLPWKEKKPNLDSNYGLASGRLRSAMRTLQQRPILLEQYHKTMMEQLEKGIIELVPKKTKDQGTVVHYLPHQPVIREDKQHTKLRVVYDGSAKAGKKSLSINQCLHRGPVLLCDLVGILLRFRIPKVCIVADIEKAFLQLSVAPKDRDACRFLWPADPKSTEWYRNINTYRFRRVTFGLICSPFLLAAAVKEHLRRDGSELSKNILENIYVDNVVIHADSTEQTSKLCQQAKEIFQRVAMNLREFASNDRDSIAKLPNEDKTPSAQLKILGVKWDTEKDEFVMHLNSETEEHPTKRTVLKKIAGVFDPMGWLAPAMLSAKQFFQNTWKEKTDWDAKLPEEERQKWRRIVEQWNHRITIPRRLFQDKSPLHLHVFADASNEAFGVAAFLCNSSATEHASRLIFAKSRVKPTNSQATIPKLELQALTLAGRVAKFLQEQVKVEKIQLWTDSQCVIHWLNSTSKLERYVENRVRKIREFNVKYVNTAENPADLVTRGLPLAELEECELWWNGPAWLSRGERITETEISFDPEEFNNRQKSDEIFHVTSAPAAERLVCSAIDLKDFSTLRKSIRITALVLRFMDKIRKKQSEKKVLTSTELKRAREALIREAQRRQPPSEETKHALELFLDDKKIWRCQGRIGHSQLKSDTQLPIWLPRGDRFTALVILDAHEKTFHSGSTTTLAYIRKTFWIAQGRKRVQTAVHQECMSCRRWLSRPYKLPKMPDLPAQRVTRSRPFENTGLDYFGPINVRQSKETEPQKIWVCIFTCLVTRAVHLEVAHDLSAETFISAFRRFIARRSAPKLIMSDNGTNFKLASKVIEEKWKEVLTSKSTQELAAERGIRWQFIAERAPWRGGFWERLISIVKNALKKTVGRRILLKNEFHTFITEIEMIINQRPLTYLSESEPILALRPIDFIIPYDTTSEAPENELEDIRDPNYRDKQTNRDTLKESFERSLQRVETFWRKWHDEYLTALRERQQSLDFKQGHTSEKFPERGEVVLVQENDIPRSGWRLALVKDLIPGKDGEIRTARIRMGNRETTRAINVLYPLEVTAHEKEPEQDHRIPQLCSAIVMNEWKENTLPLTNSRPTEMDDISLGESEIEAFEEENQQQVTVYIGTPDENGEPRTRHEQTSRKRQLSPNPSVQKRHRSDHHQPEHGRPTDRVQKSKPFRNQSNQDQARPKSYQVSRAGNFLVKGNFGPNSIQSSAPKPMQIRQIRYGSVLKPLPNVPTRSGSAPKPRPISEKDKNNDSTVITDSEPRQREVRLEEESDLPKGVWKVSGQSGWDILRTCGRHRMCPGLTVADLARTVCTGRSINFATKSEDHIPSIIQAIHIGWAIRQVTNPKARGNAAEYIQSILQEPPEKAIEIHDRMWLRVVDPKNLKKINKNGQGPQHLSNRDYKQMIENWCGACNTAHISFNQDPERTAVYGDSFVYIANEKLRGGLVKAADQLTQALALMRMQKFFPHKTPIYRPFVLVGDALLAEATPHLNGVYVVRCELKDTITELEKLHFLQTTKAVIIGTGITVTKRYHTVETYIDCLQKIDDLASKFGHVKWYLIGPPGIKGDEKREERIKKILFRQWKAFSVIKYENGQSIWGRQFEDIHDMPNGTDYASVFRALGQVGIDLVPRHEEDSDLESRLGRLADRIRGRVVTAGSVAQSREYPTKI